MVAPAATSAQIIARLHDELVRIMATPHVVERLKAIGMDNATSSTPADFGRQIEIDLARWPAIVKAAGIQPQ
jgi:tripartite-type tricarboxylate transporter receptor subunit TctC